MPAKRKEPKERKAPSGAMGRAMRRAAGFNLQTAFIRLTERIGMALGGRKIVTLDIGVDSIRLLEMSRGRVRRWTSGSLEEGLMEGSLVAHRRVLGRRVRQLMDSSGIKAKTVIASVNGLYSISRFVDLPKDSPGKSVRQMVEDLAPELMPVALEQIHLSWQQISAAPGQQRVLMVGVPINVIDSEVRSLRSAGINPRLIELRTMALARLVNRDTAIALNLDASALDIVVMVNGVPEAMRSLAWRDGGREAPEDLAEQAAHAVEMTLGYFDTYRSDIDIGEDTPILVAGHLADNPAVYEALSARLDYPVEPLASPVECPPFLPFAEYAINIGLALKASGGRGGGGNRKAPDMNLLPPEYSPWKPSRRQVMLALMVALGLGLLFPAWGLTTEAMDTTRALELRKATLDSQLGQMQSALAERAPWKNLADDHNQIVKMGDVFSDSLAVIYAEADALGVDVTAVNHRGNTVTVQCEAYSYATFQAYLDALAGSGQFVTPIPPPPGYPRITGGSIQMTPE